MWGQKAAGMDQCARRAKVPARFETNDGQDVESYAPSINVNRRHRRAFFLAPRPAQKGSISTARFDPVQKLAKRGFGRPFIFGQCFCIC